jgi:hypothetical protein
VTVLCRAVTEEAGISGVSNIVIPMTHERAQRAATFVGHQIASVACFSLQKKENGQDLSLNKTPFSQKTSSYNGTNAARESQFFE